MYPFAVNAEKEHITLYGRIFFFKVFEVALYLFT